LQKEEVKRRLFLSPTKSEDDVMPEIEDYGLKLSMTINDGIGE